MKTILTAAALALGSLLSLAAPSQAATVSYTEMTPRTVGVTKSAFAPYYTDIFVSGLGAVQNITVTLFGVTHTYADDIYAMLVGPTGASLVLMQNAGGSDDLTNANLTFSDAASKAIKNNAISNSSGTYKVSQYGSVTGVPSPAPAATAAHTLASFAGLRANGTWRLYMFDDAVGDRGSMAGWGITITAPALVPLPATLPALLGGLALMGVVARRRRAF